MTGSPAPSPVRPPAEPSDAPADVAAAVAEVIRGRRTNLQVDPADPVPDEALELLLELATWAPNHKRTWPWRFTVLRGDARWRFTVLRGDARWRFGEALAAVAAADGRTAPDKVEKLRTKYGRSPVVLLVWTTVEGDEARVREDRDATAAAVQTLLLGATALGLASYWGSLPEALWDPARRFAGLGDDHEPVALVYLGWPIGSPSAPARPAPEVTWLDE